MKLNFRNAGGESYSQGVTPLLIPGSASALAAVNSGHIPGSASRMQTIMVSPSDANSARTHGSAPLGSPATRNCARSRVRCGHGLAILYVLGIVLVFALPFALPVVYSHAIYAVDRFSTTVRRAFSQSAGEHVLSIQEQSPRSLAAEGNEVETEQHVAGDGVGPSVPLSVPLSSVGARTDAVQPPHVRSNSGGTNSGAGQSTQASMPSAVDHANGEAAPMPPAVDHAVGDHAPMPPTADYVLGQPEVAHTRGGESDHAGLAQVMPSGDGNGVGLAVVPAKPTAQLEPNSAASHEKGDATLPAAPQHGNDGAFVDNGLTLPPPPASGDAMLGIPQESTQRVQPFGRVFHDATEIPKAHAAPMQVMSSGGGSDAGLAENPGKPTAQLDPNSAGLHEENFATILPTTQTQSKDSGFGGSDSLSSAPLASVEAMPSGSVVRDRGGYPMAPTPPALLMASGGRNGAGLVEATGHPAAQLESNSAALQGDDFASLPAAPLREGSDNGFSNSVLVSSAVPPSNEVLPNTTQESMRPMQSDERVIEDSAGIPLEPSVEARAQSVGSPGQKVSGMSGSYLREATIPASDVNFGIATRDAIKPEGHENVSDPWIPHVEVMNGKLFMARTFERRLNADVAPRLVQNGDEVWGRTGVACTGGSVVFSLNQSPKLEAELQIATSCGNGKSCIIKPILTDFRRTEISLGNESDTVHYVQTYDQDGVRVHKWGPLRGALKMVLLDSALLAVRRTCDDPSASSVRILSVAEIRNILQRQQSLLSQQGGPPTTFALVEKALSYHAVPHHHIRSADVSINGVTARERGTLAPTSALGATSQVLRDRYQETF